MNDLIPQEAQKEISTVDEFIKSSNIAKIENQENYNQINETTKDIRKRRKNLEEMRFSITKPLEESKKKIIALFKAPIEKLQKFEQGLLRLQSSYMQDQEQIRLEEQRRKDEEARKERERIEAQARKQREKEEEARKTAEEARRKAQESKDDEERRKHEEEALKADLKAQQAQEKAEIKEMTAQSVVSQEVDEKVQKSGVYIVTSYDVEIVNERDFIISCVERADFIYLDINLSLLKKEAQMTKGQRQWRGIKIVEKKETRMRG